MDYILTHHGIKGQKWGIRRFQNADGTRTAAGKKRYNVNLSKATTEYAEARIAKKNSARGDERKRATRDLHSATAKLMKEHTKTLYNDRIDKGKDPIKGLDRRINKYEQKGLSNDEARLKAYGKRVGRADFVKGVSGHMALGLPGNIGINAAISVGRKKVIESQIQKEKMNNVAILPTTQLGEKYYKKAIGGVVGDPYRRAERLERKAERLDRKLTK